MKHGTVAFQGSPGAYSHEACVRLAPHETPKGFDTVPDAIAAVKRGECACALVPIEVRPAKPMADNLALVEEAGLHVTADTWMTVRHHLLGAPGASLTDIKEVRSHPVALAQCAATLNRLKLQAVEAVDTAGAARDLAKTRDRTVAVIASRTAAELYELEILRDSLEDQPGNAIRFALVGPEPRQAE